MQKYGVSQVDGSTFQVIDIQEQREICVCADYDEWEDAEQRAEKIASLLNATESLYPSIFRPIVPGDN